MTSKRSLTVPDLKEVRHGCLQNSKGGTPRYPDRGLGFCGPVMPGDVHTGVCYWIGRTPQWAREYGQAEFIDWLIPRMASGEITMVVYEIFMLYHSKAVQQTGSKFYTPELIGVMRHLCRRAKIPFVGYQASTHKSLYKNLDYRPPKKPLNSWVSYGHGGHCKDAEILGSWYLRRHEIREQGLG